MARVRIVEDVRKLSGKVHIAATGYKVQVVQPGTTTPVTVYQAATGGSTHSWFGTDSTGVIVPFNADPSTTGTAIAGGEMWADKQAVELRVLTLANVEVTRERLELVSAADALSVESSTLLAYAAAPDGLASGAITRDTNGAATSFSAAWPDGATGTYTGTPSATVLGAVDAYTITHVLGGTTTTYTQPTVTRDASGAVTNRPAITVS